jgi:hypothetical protein
MKNLSILLLIGLSAPMFGQKHDYIWVAGTPPNGNPVAGQIRFDFNTSPPQQVEATDQHLDFDLATSSFCNDIGELLYYTNGIGIEGADGNLLENGDSLNPGIAIDWYYENGSRCYNCAFFATSPWDTTQIVLFHIGADSFVMNGGHVKNTIYYTTIDKTANGGKGKVIQKNTPITSGIFTPFGATRHANGRDWWILFQEKNGKEFYKILVDNTGVHVQGTQVIEEIIPVDHAQNDNPYIFSPDGSKLAFCSKFKGVHIFDFDRCTGELSNLVYVPITVAFTDIGYGTPLAFSPNNRFLYYATEEEVRQLDLWEPDVAASEDTVAVFDGFHDEYGFPTLFWLMQLGPDGIIYFLGGGRWLHTIHHPNKKGSLADVRQRAHFLQYVAIGLPYFPNYRLGPLDGSPCDTLGLDNLPLAGFRCEADSLQPLLVTFTDNSFYEPAQWAWDFGDGGTSQDTSPVHVFPAPGVYEVCLTVSNANGGDTYCKEVYLGVSGTYVTETAIGFELYPNPSTGIFTLLFPGKGLNRQIEVMDINGKLLKRITMDDMASRQQIDLQELSNGVYLVRTIDGAKGVFSKLVSILH